MGLQDESGQVGCHVAGAERGEAASLAEVTASAVALSGGQGEGSAPREASVCAGVRAGGRPGSSTEPGPEPHPETYSELAARFYREHPVYYSLLATVQDAYERLVRAHSGALDLELERQMGPDYELYGRQGDEHYIVCYLKSLQGLWEYEEEHRDEVRRCKEEFGALASIAAL